MDGLEWKTLLKFMIWGVPRFLETPISFEGYVNGKKVDFQHVKGWQC